MAWSTDIAKAPRGHYDLQGRKAKGGSTAEHRIFHPAPVWLATRCGKVTLSRYLPEEHRWEMLAHGEQPVAWHAFDASDTYEVMYATSDKPVMRYRKPDYPVEADQ